jgi:hypothetical protein
MTVSLHSLGLLFEQFRPHAWWLQRILSYEQVKYGGLPVVEALLAEMDKALESVDTQKDD